MTGQNTGLLGGTFNPPHLGHIALCRAAAESLGLDRVVVMPAGQPPHKELSEDAPAPGERLAMTRLAFRDVAAAEVSDWELRAGGSRYTADTLTHLRALYPNDRLWLLVGADMFLTLHRWRRPEEIFMLARVAVLAREDGQERAIAAAAAFLAHRYDAAIDIIPHAPLSVSSTRLREGLRRAQGETFLPEPVYAYICQKGLYGIDKRS